jgi:hypothetical protein
MTQLRWIWLLMAYLAGIPVISHSAPAIPTQTASIGGVRIGDSRDDLRRLGKPTRVRRTGDALDPEWNFSNGLTVLFWDDGDRVAQVRSHRAAVCTDTGVCPGISASRLDELLGPDMNGQRASDGVHQYRAAYDTCWLEVSVSTDVAHSIAIVCQP